MAVEIERKYLVVDRSFEPMATECHHIVQGYLLAEPGRSIRIRIVDDTRAVITIKGAGKGAARQEFEYAIPLDDARQLINLAVGNIIDKYRYIVVHEGNRWEVDVFGGVHKGLVMAELELPSEDYTYPLPSFVGKEVTGDPRYHNAVLSRIAD